MRNECQQTGKVVKTSMTSLSSVASKAREFARRKRVSRMNEDVTWCQASARWHRPSFQAESMKRVLESALTTSVVWVQLARFVRSIHCWLHRTLAQQYCILHTPLILPALPPYLVWSSRGDWVISNYVLKSETDLTDLSCERQGDDRQVNFQLIKCAQCLTEVHDTRDSGLVISDQLNCISEQVHRIDYLSFECEAIE